MTFAHVAPARSSSAAMGRRRKRRTELLHRGSLDNCHLCGRFNFLTIRDIAGITVHPNERWMQQMARNVTMEGCGTLQDCRYLLHDRDTKYTISFRAIIESGGVKTLPLPALSPNLNAYAERWVKSVKDECLSKIILFGERSLRRALSEYVEHYHAERNHQGKSNVLLFRRVTQTRREEPVQCRERLGGLLRYY